MQDGKALQAGTSHYLGTHFAEAQNIRYQAEDGSLKVCHTTSWGVTTRLIGAIVMTHGDDDGLRLPPAIAPRQIVIVPITRDTPEDAKVIEFCDALAADLHGASAFGRPLRALVDKKPVRSAEKRWDWVRRGAPLILEIGPRDIASGNVSFMRRDDLRDGDKVRSHTLARDAFAKFAPDLLREIQGALFREAKQRLDTNIRTDIKTFDELAAYFGAASDNEDEESGVFKGWVRAPWSKPSGAALEAIDEKLKSLKLTIRNAPLGQHGGGGRCIFSGVAAVEEIIISRAY